MKCSDIMKKSVQCAGVGETVAAVAARMRDQNIGFLPVCGESGRAIGTVTDRDLTTRVLAECCGPGVCVETVMTKGVITCRPEDDLRIAEELMSQYKISRIVCSDRSGRPVGVISLSDIAAV